MVDKIADIKGMDDASAAKLAEAGITTVAQLLEKADTTAERAALAKQVGLDARQITEWVNRADLMRVNGIGTEFANLLEEGGVDSCKELQHRVAANLHVKLQQINDEKKIAYRAPSLSQLEDWISQAKEISAKA